MADLEDGDGSVENADACSDDGVQSSNERRGCKRRLEDDPSKDIRNVAVTTIDNGCDSEASMPEQESAVTTNMVEEKGEAALPEASAEVADSNIGVVSDDKATALEVSEDPVEGTISPASHVAETSPDIPEGMLLEWNSDKTTAILTVLSEMPSRTASADRELRVCLVGRAKIRVVEGSAEVLGHALKGPNQNNNDDGDDDDESSLSACGVVVTSPYWSSWMTIEANPLFLPCKIVLDCVRGPESFTVTGPKRPILLPETWRTCADNIVRDFCASPSNSNHSNRFRGSAVMADSLEDYDETSGGGNRRYRNPDETRRVCMITGAKGVGKSTLLRYLTNRILSASPSSRSDPNEIGGIQEVAILDTDVGQPELAPPGLLRLSIVRKPLLQPPYWNLVGEAMIDGEEKFNGGGGDRDNEQQGPCHVPQQEHSRLTEHDPESDEDEENENGGVEVVSSVFFGASTSKVDPTRYINAVQFLMEKYETEVAHSGPYPIPLLINMDGWVKGVGYQILTALTDSLGPTHFVQILGDTPGQTFDLPPTVFGSTIYDDGSDEAHIAHPVASAISDTVSSTFPPKVYMLQACQTMPGASLCRIPAFTTRNFRWATYFLPNEIQTFDAWDFVSAKFLQTGWIAATNSDMTTTVPQWWHASTIAAVDDNTDNKINNTTANEVGGDDEGDEEQNDSELSDECRLAKALARERPYCVPMEAVEAFVIESDFEDYLRVPIGETDTDIVDRTYDRIFRALNGRVVALCTNTSTMESLGYGILRSIDWEKRLLYVLVSPSVVAGRTKNSSSAALLLSSVKALVGGSLPLPLAMLYRGVYAESFPYLTNLSKKAIHTSVMLGSEPMKSRNNIGRRGLANAEKNAN
jgi:polynucleotide 5'-kinase involved in rRNA processing